MSEEEDQLTPENSELSKIINDLDIDHKLNSAAQRGESELVKDLLLSGAQVVTDEVSLLCIRQTDLPTSDGATHYYLSSGQQ